MKKETLETLNTYWNQAYPDSWPLAHEFKQVYPERWVRFHSLPDSKRYAQRQQETSILLERHNSVLEDLNLSQPNPLWLLTSEWSCGTSLILKRSQDSLLELDPSAVFWKSRRVLNNSEDDDAVYQHLFVSLWTWHKHLFDPLLKLVANDFLANVMIVSMSGKWLYHPYDGGADVILSSASERDILRDKYSSWLSKHPLGY
jgi:hypothetical protein